MHSFAKAELRAKRERGRCGGVGGERERERARGGREGGREERGRGRQKESKSARWRARAKRTLLWAREGSS